MSIFSSSTFSIRHFATDFLARSSVFGAGAIGRPASTFASPMFAVYGLAVTAIGSLALIYWIILLGSVAIDDVEPKHVAHVGVSVLLNILCLVFAFKARGSLTSRLRTSMAGVFITVGMLLLIILSLRLYYSRPVLFISVFASIALVTVFALLIERRRRLRIGIVPQGLDGTLMNLVGEDAVLIASANEPAWAYDVILINWSKVADQRWSRFASRAILSGCDVQHVAAFIEDRQGRVLAQDFETDHAALPRMSRYVTDYKRPLDILLVVILAPLALLIVGIASIGILLTMGGPVLFTQWRTGLDGRPFKMYKLRTMVPSAQGTSSIATAVGDKRITPLGKFLRRFRIDELPQFYNILIGDMSLVGPRPEQPDLVGRYARLLPAFNNRTMVRPGITGWAQVRGTYAADELETENKLAYDLYYVKHASFVMDFSVALQTFKTLLTGNSAR